MSRFDYVKYDEKACDIQAKTKMIVEVLEGKIMGIGAMSTIEALNKPGGDMQIIDRLVESKRNALRSLEECYMWIGKAVRDDQLVRTPAEVPLEEERHDG